MATDLKKKSQRATVSIIFYNVHHGERYYFSFQMFYVPRTHALVQILVNFGRSFFGGKLKVDVKIIGWMRRYTERRSDNFRRSQDESQSDGK